MENPTGDRYTPGRHLGIIIHLSGTLRNVFSGELVRVFASARIALSFGS